MQGVSIPLRFNEMAGSLNVAQCVSFTDDLGDDLNGPLGKLFMLIPFLLEGSQKHLNAVGEQLCNLTLRESEVLKWSGVGKTTWEMSCILDVQREPSIFTLQMRVESWALSAGGKPSAWRWRRD